MGMEPIKSIADTIPFLKEAAAKSKINSEYLLIGICLISFLIIHRTIFGTIISTFFSLYIPVRDAILVVRSPNPKIGEMRKIIVVFIVLALLSLIESCGIRSIFPLFSLVKTIILYWTCVKEDNANLIVDLVIRKIPNEWLRYGNSIQDAVRAAAKSIPKVDIKKDSIEINKKN